MLTYACLLRRYYLNVSLCFTRVNVQTVFLVVTPVITSVHTGHLCVRHVRSLLLHK